MKKFLIGVLFFVFSHTTFAQGQSMELSLGCEHLYAIQQRFILDHINFKNFTYKLEKRVIDQYVKQLDSSKLYLRTGDVSRIKKEMKDVFAQVKNRKCVSIVKSYDLFKKRVKERVAFVKKTLNKDFKFNKNTELVLDSKLRKYPRTIAEQNRFHKKYLQFQLATYIATDSSLEEAKDSVISSYERMLKKIQNRKNEDLFASYLDSFANGLDPHSGFLSKDVLEDFQISMRLSLEGIGATLSSKDGFTVIEQLITGGAAFRSGKLKPKDKIVAVAQAKGKDEFEKPVNVIEMELRDVVSKIRGAKGTKVKLTILRKEAKETKQFEVVLVRDKIKLEDEAANVHYIDKSIKGQKKKVALINLPSFYADSSKADGKSAAKDMKKILKDVRAKKADAVVLDLSTNGGGSLDDAVDIAGLFFKTGNVVKQSQKDSSKGELPLADKDPQVDWSGPLVVLISRVSASASEIVSGTLKDYKRAVVVGGDHTFGKGSVQSIRYVPRNLGAWKTTVGMFFTAGGASTQHRGVDADIVFPSAFSTDEIGEKNLDYSLPPKKIKSFLSKSAYVKKGKGAWSIVDNSTIKTLRKKAEVRIKKNKDFNEVLKDLAKNKKRGKVIKVSELLEKEDDKKGTNKKEEENLSLTKEEKLKKYLERADIVEAVNIAADFVELTQGPEIQIGAKKPKSAKLTN